MDEPLCTYLRYERFKSISERIGKENEQDTLNSVKEVISEMDIVY